jgi:hypothetical protein
MGSILLHKNDEKEKLFIIDGQQRVNQKDTNTNTVSREQLNKFGNLALVSRSVNSEYRIYHLMKNANAL